MVSHAKVEEKLTCSVTKFGPKFVFTYVVVIFLYFSVAMTSGDVFSSYICLWNFSTLNSASSRVNEFSPQGIPCLKSELTAHPLL